MRTSVAIAVVCKFGGTECYALYAMDPEQEAYLERGDVSCDISTEGHLACVILGLAVENAPQSVRRKTMSPSDVLLFASSTSERCEPVCFTAGTKHYIIHA